MNSRKIVILGGGTAGWIAANLIAKSWCDKDIHVGVVESPDIGIIGVGEGSTPQFKAFMDFIEVPESQWMPKCNATYKNGIRFVNWSTRPGFEQYFHPFPAQPDDYSAPAFFHNSFVRRKGIDLEGHPDLFFLSTYLAEHAKAPIAAENFPFEINYGYHFDSGKLGQLLAEKAREFGVEHIQARVTDVRKNTDGTIAALVCEEGQEICGDIFIDCSGFSGLLMQQHMQVGFESFENNLFNDSAVVLATEQGNVIASETTSVARKFGWSWHIPLTNRIGNGYVYSSKYCGKDQAETELRAALGLLDSDVEARHLNMKVGQVKEHWHKNCVAIGLSQGFIEPLEATALHIVQETVQSFIECYQEQNFSCKGQDKHNQMMSQRYQAIRDYIVAHYRVNSRTDTAYWRDNANNNQLSKSLFDVLNTWVQGKNLSDELDRQDIDKYYPSASWHCLLAGYGIYPEQRQLVAASQSTNKHDLSQIRDYIRRCGLNFADHRAQLARFID
ncbi:tryptophan halogenase family protein [Pseudoalteromonas luteoviolacea]|uniref:Tryptophan halogenase n=1 Tax=Pseudoalteromonas luteoviolacea NCIMB 1942 TaxID=1365253 RepID=A0A166Z787_9GAMM|nr:tryptophan halogenase family protein [Pseudoalteromonas luteoviolacea]KZN44012.1 tryptophan halogenase [Pseudoalteromonas luteoviolacea NCIMB 1942]KZX00651.1 tryptophan halogenase [Pseudoalteromonas luteoviolacea]